MIDPRVKYENDAKPCDLVMRAVEYLRGAEGDRADTEAEARDASQVQV